MVMPTRITALLRPVTGNPCQPLNEQGVTHKNRQHATL